MANTETMCERITHMTFEEMRSFIYKVYCHGVHDGQNGQWDSVCGYFGGAFLNYPSQIVMKDLEDDLNM